jgi:hypothetical protein
MSPSEHAAEVRAASARAMPFLRSVTAWALIGVFAVSRCTAADDAAGAHPQNRTRSSVTGEIFSDRHIPDSALPVHRRAATMSAGPRYEFLANWVLPGDSHRTIRLALDFTPTQPAPFAVENSAQQESRNDRQTVRIAAGGTLVSPALDLIRTATALGRLEELRSRIKAGEPADELQQRSRLAMLGLVELATGECERANSHFEELYSRVAADTRDDFSERWPETLAVHAGLQHPQTREAAAEMLFRMLQSQVRSGVARGPDAWDRWVTAAAGQLNGPRLLKETDGTATTVPAAAAVRESNWLPVSRMTAWSRGQGLTPAAWMRQGAVAVNTASHTEDYLYYRIPLRGDFEVECDVTSFGWRDSHLMVAGTYVAPIWDHVSYGIGSFREPRPAGVVRPRLSESDEWIRYRTVMRGGTASTYFNGRLIHIEQLEADHDPWLAVRSEWFADGAVRNLRITGKPVVPDRLELSSGKDLPGWFAYFDEPVGGEAGHWRTSGDGSGRRRIIGPREPALQGEVCERLLQFHRPMLEDGTIEYEFLYVPGESLVHPALDRRVWILDPTGVGIHWVTDGRFERNGLDPGNLTHETEIRRGPPALPLRSGEWNRLRLELKGDGVELSLNGVPVCRDALENTNQRTFGVFYWSDRTEAQIRNVVWRGDWPRELPPVESQELAGAGTNWLDERLPQPSARLDYDFARDGLPPEWPLPESKAQHRAEAADGGVRVVVNGGIGFSPWWIGPRLRVEGDFDIQAAFDRLELSGNDDSSVGAFLMVVFDEPEVTHAGIYRGRLTKSGTPDRVVVQTEFNRTKPAGIAMDWPGSTAEESVSGTFRLARRGDTIHCLFAEADSAQFRLIHSEVVPRAPIRLDGLRLVSSISSRIDRPCESAITWKRLSIQAERIHNPPNPGVVHTSKSAH